MLVHQDGTTENRTVKTGIYSDDYVEIIDGLSEEDQISVSYTVSGKSRAAAVSIRRRQCEKRKAKAMTIRLAGIKKIYQMGSQQVAALDGIDLHIKRGIYSTYGAVGVRQIEALMNILGCLDRPTGRDSIVLMGVKWRICER